MRPLTTKEYSLVIEGLMRVAYNAEGFAKDEYFSETARASYADDHKAAEDLRRYLSRLLPAQIQIDTEPLL